MVATAQGAEPKATAPLKPAGAPAFKLASMRREDRFLKALIYGPYGVGKTVFAASAQDVPAMKDTIFIDAEAGGLSIAHRTDIDTVRINEYRQVTQVYEYLRAHCKYRDEGNEEKLIELEGLVRGTAPKVAKKYRTVVIDSLTEVQKYLMYQLLGVRISTQKLDQEMENPQFAEWGKQSEMLRLLVRSFRDLPMHVIFIAAESIVEDDRKVQNRRLNLPGKLSTDVPGFLDVVGYYGSLKNAEGETTRRLLIQPTDRIQAKNRFSTSQVEYLDNPTMADLAKIALG